MKKSISPIDTSTILIRIFVSLFFVILWLPLVQMHFPFIPEVNSNERRTLTQKPSIRQMIHPYFDPYWYVTLYNHYFNYHYGFRNSLTRLNSILHLTIFNTSPTPVVIIGNHGWLMYNSPTDGVSLKDYYGNANFTENELKKIKSRIIDINEELKKRKIHFLLAVAPNKHVIYPEYLPANIRQAEGRKTRLDQVTQALNNSDVDFIDLRFRLRDEKKQNTDPLYYRTDTHWNALGAFFAYEEIMTHLRRTYPGIKPLHRDDFHIRSEENRGMGDLANLLNMSGLLSDTSIKLTPKTKFIAEPVPVPADHAPGTEGDPVGFQVQNLDLPGLVMFHDSFGDSLIPYLSEGFSKSIYILSGKIDISIIAREKPSIVIFEITERKLGNLGEL